MNAIEMRKVYFKSRKHLPFPSTALSPSDLKNDNLVEYITMIEPEFQRFSFSVYRKKWKIWKLKLMYITLYSALLSLLLSFFSGSINGFVVLSCFPDY